MIKVTFIVTGLDNKENLKCCFESILNQKNISKEIIFIGDTDNIDKKLEELNNNHNATVIYEKTEDLSIGEIRNRGIDLATGEYICFVNSNDFLEMDSINILIEKSIELNSEIIIGKSALYNSKNDTYTFKQVNESLNRENALNGYSNPEVFDDMNICNKIIKTSFIKENNIKFADTSYYDYILFLVSAYLKAKAIYVFPRAFYNETMKLGLEKVKNPVLEEKIDILQIDDFIKVLQSSLEFQDKNKITQNNEIIINKYVEFILRRGLKYLNVTRDKELIFKKIADSLETVNIQTLKLSKKNKEILNIVKAGKLEDYYKFLEDNKNQKRKKTNLKSYLTYKMFGEVYSLISKFPIKKNSILFISHSPGMDGNYSYIYDGIEKYNKTVSKSKRFRCKFVSTKTGILGKILMPFKLARVEYIMLSENVPFFQYIDIRKETKVVQTWHAAGAFKKFGFSTSYMSGGPNPFENKKMTMHRYYDYATVSSEDVRKHYAEAFDMDVENVIPVGVPRADFFFDEKKVSETKDKIYNLFPNLKDKKVILYAPTFRGFGKTRKSFNIEFDFNKIAKNISDEYVIALKLHPSVEISNIKIYDENSEKVVNVSSYSDANDILTVTDLLISDYSSIIFDYSLLNRPMLFFAYDLDEYRYDRDFYYEYEEFVPGPIAKTNDEIIDLINNWNFDLSKVEDFSEKFFVSRDGKNTERFIEEILLKRDKRGE